MKNPIQDRAEMEYQEFLRLSRSRTNAPRYAILCDDLGIKSGERDEDLYDAGVLENMLAIKSQTDLEARFTPKGKVRKLSPLNNYVLKFLSEAKHLVSSSFDKNVSEKERLLTQYFKRFRSEGTQNLSKYAPAQIGSMFNQVVRSYIEAADANNQEY